jgi:hypothetical protein
LSLSGQIYGESRIWNLEFGGGPGEAHDKLQMTNDKWRMLGTNLYLLFAIRSVPQGRFGRGLLIFLLCTSLPSNLVFREDLCLVAVL